MNIQALSSQSPAPPKTEPLRSSQPLREHSKQSSSATVTMESLHNSSDFSPMPWFIIDPGSTHALLPVPPTVITLSQLSPSDGPHAPHQKFLSHTSARNPEITVETSDKYYKLTLALPDYDHNSITLSVRRRQLLHIVADSWAPGGGHIERCVSFGYDVDLNQARAGFDGVYLRVTVPRHAAIARG